MDSLRTPGKPLQKLYETKYYLFRVVNTFFVPYFLLNNDYIFASPYSLFNIIFLLENKGNPVSEVSDASSTVLKNVIIQFPCH